jgi:PAS domain S-box-containing protein
MLTVFVMTLFGYYEARQEHRAARLHDLKEQAQQLNSRLTIIVDSLTGIRELATFYLEYPEELSGRAPTFIQEGQRYFLDNISRKPINNQALLRGNITGIGNINLFDRAMKHELIMAQALTPAFVTAQKSIKDANWLYYVSLNRFVNLYPWVPRSIWQYSDKSLTNSLVAKIKSAKYDDQHFWSRPYIDSAGKGLNTALGMGVYHQHQLTGAVLIDVSTAGLYKYLADIKQKNHGYIIVDKNSNVLLHKQNNNQKLNAREAWSDAAPEALNTLSYQDLVNLAATSEKGSWIIQKQKLHANDWLLLEYQGKSDFTAAIDQRFLMIFIALFLGLLSLIIIVYYVTHRTFIKPSKQFISHIEHCSAGDPGKIKPSIEWQHWFKIVEDLFGQNRSLMQRLKDQNTDLDRRVHEKTQALQLKSEQHQRDYALLRSVMDALPDFIIFNDPQGKLIGCNQAFEKYCNQREIHILGQHAGELLSNELGKALTIISQDIASATMAAPQQSVVETHKRTFEIFSSPFYNDDNVMLGTINLIRDVTEQVATHTALELAKNQAVDANKAKSQFLANMSHEIRTPINAIQGMFFLLKQSQLDKVQSQYLVNAQSASASLLYLVDELLDLAKVESGNMSIIHAKTELDSIIERVLLLNVSALNNKNLRLVIEIESGVPENIFTDKMRVVQVLSNLLNNAIKFTEQGLITLSVAEVSDAKNNDNSDTCAVQFSIKDTGIGVAKSKQSSLFEAFKQADESMTRKYGGSGLGLSICQHIVHLLDGDIFMTSELGQGSEFGFVLPFKCHSDIKLAAVQNSGIQLYRCGVEISSTLSDNFSKVGLEVIPLSSIEALDSATDEKVKICLLDSSEYQEGFTKSQLTTIDHQNCIVGLCRPVSAEISDKLIKQLASKKVDYILLEQPLYRNVIKKITQETRALRQISPPQSVKHLPMAEPTKDLMGLYVLLVEDNLVNQLVAMKLLQALQARVIIAENGQQALEVLKTENVDVVLMDIQMPVMDGLTATKHIRAQQQFSNLPVIAMTAHAREEDKQQCFEVGMNLHIAKPVSIDNLGISILKVLNRE